jgi:hypothetical protein
MPKKIPINYTSRDYETIKSDLVSIAKKYYPNTFKDFSESGFGSMMMDTVAYVGDILSFYVDYQANESFFDTAIEYNNIIKLSKQLGYKFSGAQSSQGILTFYVSVPADSSGLQPDASYYPIIKKGSTFSTSGGNTFTLVDDVIVSNPDNTVVVGQVDENSGIPITYIVRAYGRVVSGRIQTVFSEVGNYIKFLKVKVEANNISEIVEVTDTQGNKYYEVDYLSQDIIYRAIVNRSETNRYAPSLLKPFNVPRRFVVERDGSSTYLQFGSGYDSTGNISDAIIDPSKTVLKLNGKDYFTDEEFDPSNLIQSDAFGIVPENTTLQITVRTNTSQNTNSGVDTITKIGNLLYEFEDLTAINSSTAGAVISSIEISNEEPILGNVSKLSVEELKRNVINSYGSQNRAVTKQDYEALCYKMPPVFGGVKRVKASRDADSFKRNINLHVISEDSSGKLIESNSAIKENLKVWLNKSRMINDTIDILDTKIINFGINFEIVTEVTYDKYEALTNALREVRTEFSRLRDIGEPLFITDIYTALKKAEGVLDVSDVNILIKTGGLYSDFSINITNSLSPDGRYIIIPEDAIFEIKYPEEDIKGRIK